ncbi:hypothetical protein [Abyssalbus ytuae]|uniref:Uncharacterized protein n=1 Tax=Abyssalbus ytuae TaxID=2926907 RepID=A0A9E6ZM01_9FLAO|nr:hypothetical protein [Abyssalbus ytuae]UOB16665.1 hypothetical protein MQE35_13075 [Abyssalbus ytuae]
MKKTILACVFLITITRAMAQLPLPPTYIDPTGAAALGAEAAAAEALKKAKSETSKEWVSTSVGTVAEISGTTTLGKPVRYVHFIKYANMCDSFVNNKKRKLCEEKVQYLRHSHDIVYELLNVEPLYEMRKGVRDLIWEKYASISNIIIKELEKIKRETEKEDKKRDLKYKG